MFKRTWFYMDISLLADHQHTAGEIAKWYLTEWGHTMPEEQKLSLKDKVLLGINRDTLPLTLLAHIGTNPVGVAELKYRKLAQYPHWHHWLDGVYVPPEQRGKGISAKLIYAAITRVRSLNLSSVYLRCESHNIALYEKFGFVSLKTEKDKGVTKTVMGLTLGKECEL